MKYIYIYVDFHDMIAITVIEPVSSEDDEN